ISASRRGRSGRSTRTGRGRVPLELACHTHRGAPRHGRDAHLRRALVAAQADEVEHRAGHERRPGRDRRDLAQLVGAIGLVPRLVGRDGPLRHVARLGLDRVLGVLRIDEQRRRGQAERDADPHRRGADRPQRPPLVDAVGGWLGRRLRPRPRRERGDRDDHHQPRHASMILARRGPCYGPDHMSNAPRNRLAGEKSPYLLQHAGNPVDWFPWGDEAFARARAEDKPIFLSVGYSTCHWCHVMERESFEDPTVAAKLRDGFIAVKVDREERPDVDRVYMTFVQATTGGGGWPMSVFLTPDLKPFFGGTYFPPASRGGMIGFPQLLERIDELWRTRRHDIEESGAQVVAELRRAEAGGEPVLLD